MPKERMLWSCDGKNSVRSSKLRSFAIIGQNTFNGYNYRLIGMFNKTDDFEFGIFNTEEEAVTFLVGIHKIIEGGK